MGRKFRIPILLFERAPGPDHPCQIYEAGWNESAWSYPPAVGEDGYIGSVAYYDRSDTEYWSPFSDSSGPFDVIPFPLENVHRNAIYTSYRHTFFWFGVLANGSQIEPGNYT